MREKARGEISILYKGQLPAYTVYRKQQRQAEVVSSKAIDNNLKKLHQPSKDHPWRQYGQRISGKPNTEAAQY